MPEQNTTPESFPQEDIERIREKYEQLKELPEFERVEKREVIKESIKQAFPTTASSVSSSSAPAVTDHNEEQLLPDYMRNDPEEDKGEVETLLHIALTDGIAAGVKESKRRRARIMDNFHDALTDKVMPHMQNLESNN